MINVALDCETIPAQGNARQAFIDRAVESYKPPSKMTKAEACSDLRMTPDEAKEVGKGEAIDIWVEEFGLAAAEAAGDAEWRKTSFDGGQGEVISIAWAVGDAEIYDVSRYSHDDKQERDMMRTFFIELRSMLDSGRGITDKPYFIGHNIPFDLKFLFRRAVILGIKPPFELPFNGWHGKDYYDNEKAWCGNKGNISQDNLCKALGLEGKPDGISGAEVWDQVKAGNIGKVVNYNKDDVRAVREVYKRLTFA